MAYLKNSIVAGDLRVTGTMYGDVPLTDLVSTDLIYGWTGEIKAITDDEDLPGLDIKVFKSSNPLSYASIQMLGDSGSGDVDKPSIDLYASEIGLHATRGLNIVSNSTSIRLSTGVPRNNNATWGTSDEKWPNIYTSQINGVYMPNLTAQTTQAVYPIKINALGQITGYGSAVTIPAAVSVKGNAESSYRTGQVNLTPANLGISATTTSVTVGSTTFNKYTHPTDAGNKHIPSGGSSGQYLKYASSGTATWASLAVGSTSGYAVYTTTSGALTASSFYTQSPSTNGTGLAFISTVSQDDKGQITATKATVQNASDSQSGVVSLGTQTFAGNKTFKSDKFTVQASEIRLRNKNNDNNQATSGTNDSTTYPYVTSLMIGDGREVTLDEFGDGKLAIHSKGPIFIQTNSSDIKQYDATKTYSVGNLVWYNRAYYRCTTAITTAEAWNSSHWTDIFFNTSNTIKIDGNVHPLNSENQYLGSISYRWGQIHGNLVIRYINDAIPTSTSGSWTIDSNNKRVTISDSKIKSSSILQWTLGLNTTQAQYEAFANAQFVDYSTADGSATITALGDMPTIAIPIRIYILGRSE